jgi:hypothetical protein
MLECCQSLVAIQVSSMKESVAARSRARRVLPPRIEPRVGGTQQRCVLVSLSHAKSMERKQVAIPNRVTLSLSLSVQSSSSSMAAPVSEPHMSRMVMQLVVQKAVHRVLEECRKAWTDLDTAEDERTLHALSELEAVWDGVLYRMAASSLSLGIEKRNALSTLLLRMQAWRGFLIERGGLPQPRVVAAPSAERLYVRSTQCTHTLCFTRTRIAHLHSQARFRRRRTRLDERIPFRSQQNSVALTPKPFMVSQPRGQATDV